MDTARITHGTSEIITHGESRYDIESSRAVAVRESEDDTAASWAADEDQRIDYDVAVAKTLTLMFISMSRLCLKYLRSSLERATGKQGSQG
ncbi:hypothetical protein CVT26_003878 [Gymnopilus dilepis]|uniref:Uncharacterized protein n=1 Tax=Gymnopilus dilepis TaxID=231916 RepID=A0A409X3G0_9AGAR|nr:hypothetical protein CVT26_003878 [Gymnopilus dilepis]